MKSSQLEMRVRDAYTQIAQDPALDPPFPTGRVLAEDAGYPDSLLDTLPLLSVEAFCGLSNVSIFAEIGPHDIVLDVGCGAGLDTLVAAQRAAKVVGVDFSQAMLERARGAVHESGLTSKVTLLHCSAQQLPLLDSSIDTVIVNGIFNLNPHRRQLFAELARVVRPGGVVFAAEIVLKEPLPEDVLGNTKDWFS